MTEGHCFQSWFNGVRSDSCQMSFKEALNKAKAIMTVPVAGVYSQV